MSVKWGTRLHVKESGSDEMNSEVNLKEYEMHKDSTFYV